MEGYQPDGLGGDGRRGLPLAAYLYAAALALLTAFELGGLASSPALGPALIRGGYPTVFSTGFSLPGSQGAAYGAAAVSALMLVIPVLSARRVASGSAPLLSLLALSSAAVAAALLTQGSVSLTLSALAALLLSCSVLVMSWPVWRVPPGRVLALFVLVELGVFATVEGASALRWGANGIDGQPPFSGPSWVAGYIDFQLFALSAPYAPQLAIMLFASWPLRMLARAYWGDLRAFLAAKLRTSGPSPTPGKGSGSVPAVLLGASFAAAVLVGVYPYLPAINPKAIFVGTDVAFNGYYYNALVSMLSLPPAQAVWGASGSDRFLLLLAQYVVAVASGSPGFAIKAMPALLGLVLVAGSYWFAVFGTKDRFLAATCAFLAVASPMTVAGVNGGIYAAWLALAVALVYSVLLLTALERPTPASLALAAAAFVLLVFTHTWTWLVMLGVTSVYGLATVLRNLASGAGTITRKELSVLVGVIATGAMAFVAKSFLPRSSAAGPVTTTLLRLDPAGVFQVYGTLATSFQVYLGGGAADPLTFVLAAIGLFSLSHFESRFSRLLVAWAVVGTVGVLFTRFSFEFVQLRLLLTLPIPLFAAMGLVTVLRGTESFANSLGISPGWARATQLLLMAAVFGASISYVLRMVGFLYTGA